MAPSRNITCSGGPVPEAFKVSWRRKAGAAGRHMNTPLRCCAFLHFLGVSRASRGTCVPAWLASWFWHCRARSRCVCRLPTVSVILSPEVYSLLFIHVFHGLCSLDIVLITAFVVPVYDMILSVKAHLPCRSVPWDSLRWMPSCPWVCRLQTCMVQNRTHSIVPCSC